MIRRAGSFRSSGWLLASAMILAVGLVALVQSVSSWPGVASRSSTRPEDDRRPIEVERASSEANEELEESVSGSGQRTLAFVPRPAGGPEVTGLDRIVHGKVLDDAGSPAPGVEIEAGLEHPGKREPLARGTSAADGSFEIPVSVDAGAFGHEGFRLYARIRREGFQKDVDSARLLSNGPEPELRLKLVRGATLSGRILQLDGKPVRTASIRLRDATGNRRSVRETTWAHRGLFDLHFDRGGPFDLEVQAKGVGVATLENLELDQGRDPEPVTITIRERGTLGGVLRDRAGNGVPNVTLATFPEGRILDDAAELRGADSGEKDGTEAGLRHNGVATDTHGCFRFDALAPGRYFIVAFVPGDKTPFDQDRTLYTTGDEHIALARDVGPAESIPVDGVRHGGEGVSMRARARPR